MANSNAKDFPLVQGRLQKQESQSKPNSVRLKKQLVPPPPPVIPLGNQLTYLSGAPLELLSESELMAKREDMVTQIANAQKLLAQKEQYRKEKKERLELFVSLFKEGVVSRRELENSEKELEQVEAEVSEAQRKASDLSHDLTKINGRLRELKASKQSHVGKGVAKK